MSAALSKSALLERIVASLEADLALLLQAAKTAHAAATHEENIPDNKYATLGLEASYLAQAQANRAQQIRVALEAFRRLEPVSFAAGAQIRLGALVTLEDEDGGRRMLLLGPEAGGLKVRVGTAEVMVITPGSPLGRALLGAVAGDLVTCGAESAGAAEREFEVLEVA